MKTEIRKRAGATRGSRNAAGKTHSLNPDDYQIELVVDGWDQPWQQLPTALLMDSRERFFLCNIGGASDSVTREQLRTARPVSVPDALRWFQHVVMACDASESGTSFTGSIFNVARVAEPMLRKGKARSILPPLEMKLAA